MMEGSKSNTRSRFSWADEVEKDEEEEEARAHQCRKQKQNPFGSARPREVVLQEKGVDWRKLDQKLQEPINLSRNEDESIQAAAAAAAAGKHPCLPRSSSGVGVKRKIENPINGCNRNRAPLTVLNHNGILVPPLKYPPKNIVVQMNETELQYNTYRPDFTSVELLNHHHSTVGEGYCNVRMMRDSPTHMERGLQNMDDKYNRGKCLTDPPHLQPLMDERRFAALDRDLRRRSADREGFTWEDNRDEEFERRHSLAPNNNAHNSRRRLDNRRGDSVSERRNMDEFEYRNPRFKEAKFTGPSSARKGMDRRKKANVK